MFVPAWILALVLITVFGAWGLVIELTVLAVQAAWWCIKAPFRLTWWLVGLPLRFLRWMATGQFVEDWRRWQREAREHERKAREEAREAYSIPGWYDAPPAEAAEQRPLS